MKDSILIVDKKTCYRESTSKKLLCRTKTQGTLLAIFALLVLLSASIGLRAQTETFSSGAFIVNMGVTPQTVGNALKPYGMIYDLIYNYGVAVKWIIEPTKSFDGIDFTYDGVDYKGGPFLIPAEYRSTAVNSRITYWQSQGVVGVTTTAPVTVPVAKTITVSSAPRWTLDKKNGKIVVGYFENAGIPTTAYGGSTSTSWKDPADLNDCDDVFSLPHADPTWAVHGHIYDWIQNTKGSLWTACHSGSAIELMFNPSNPSQQTNFLSEKTGTATGAGPYASPNNSLIAWGLHSNGTPPYTYQYPAHPVMQFMGSMDAALQNGSEQIYIPVQAAGAGWRTSTSVGIYDPDHPQSTLSDAKYDAAAAVWGYAFGNSNNGYIMYQAGHSHNKGTTPPWIAAQRMFFNFGFFSAKLKSPDPEITVDLSSVYSGTNNNLTFALNGDRNINEFTIKWESDCGGSFSPDNAQNTVYTAPVVSSETSCMITITLTDACGRIYKSATPFTIKCGLDVTSSVVNPCSSSPNAGEISFSVTGATGPFTWTWTRTSPAGGPQSGTGSPITGLSEGTYNVTVTANNGAGCSGTFTTVLSLSPEIIITATPVQPNCFGGSNGAINVSVSGGVPPFTYSWSDGPTTQNRSGLTAGTYTLTVTDSKGCTKVENVVVTDPADITITPAITDVTCYGFNNGIINLTVSGGTSPYTYLWNDGVATQNRSGLAPGIYSVTVTDSKGCNKTAAGLMVDQPTAALSLSGTQVNVDCYGNSTGSINLTVSGGTAPYTYAWTGPGGYSSNVEDISSLAAGDYSVIVTDANGCVSSTLFTITQLPVLTLTAVVTNPTCPPDAQQNFADGAIDLTVSGGTAPYTYLWTASGTGIVPGGQSGQQDLTSLVAGTYSVTVTDDNGCSNTYSVTLNYLNPNPVQPTQITIEE